MIRHELRGFSQHFPSGFVNVEVVAVDDDTGYQFAVRLDVLPHEDDLNAIVDEHKKDTGDEIGDTWNENAVAAFASKVLGKEVEVVSIEKKPTPEEIVTVGPGSQEARGKVTGPHDVLGTVDDGN